MERVNLGQGDVRFTEKWFGESEDVLELVGANLTGLSKTGIEAIREVIEACQDIITSVTYRYNDGRIILTLKYSEKEFCIDVPSEYVQLKQLLEEFVFLISRSEDSINFLITITRCSKKNHEELVA